MKKLKYGIIGCGSFGEQHMIGIQRLHNVELVAICDTNMERCQELADKYGIKQVYQDYRELLKNDEIEAVTIVTPDQTHAEVSIAAMNAGKHVLCEKPMALDLDECCDMIRVSDATGKKLMIGQICRFTPGFMEAKRLVDAGAIGELFFVESEYAHDYSYMKGPDNWRITPERHPIIGGACHAIDLLRWIAGDPEETTAYSNHKMLPGWPVDDCTIAIFKFPNHVIGKVFCSIGCKREYTMRTVLYGTLGTITVNNTDPYIYINRTQISDGAKALNGILGGEEHEHVVRKNIQINNHNVQNESEQFCNAIIQGQPVMTNGREGAKTVAVCKAVIESCECGSPIKITYDF